jgi:alkylation response protein AidB-like acyl-CoA dehydrogenase
MNFSMTEDQISLRDTVRALVEGELPLRLRGNTLNPENAAGLWQKMAEVGVLGLCFSAAANGSELSAVERMLTAIELGRGLVAAQWQMSSVAAGELVKHAMKPAEGLSFLSSLSNGDRKATVALDARSDVMINETFLNGVCRYVHGIESCDWLFLMTSNSHSPNKNLWVCVDLRDDSVSIQRLTLLDGSIGAHVRFKNTRVLEMLERSQNALKLLEIVRNRLMASQVAEALGAMQVLLELTVEHLNSRKQFGAALAKFQVLQHKMADLVMIYEQLYSLACLAAMAAEGEEEGRYAHAAMAYLSKHSKPFCEAVVQLHGAMGVTDECRVGHFVKRIILLAHCHGSAAKHRAEYIRNLQ